MLCFSFKSILGHCGRLKSIWAPCVCSSLSYLYSSVNLLIIGNERSKFVVSLVRRIELESQKSTLKKFLRSFYRSRGRNFPHRTRTALVVRTRFWKESGLFEGVLWMTFAKESDYGCMMSKTKNFNGQNSHPKHK